MEVNKLSLNYNDVVSSVEKYKSNGEFTNNLIDGNINLIYKTTNNSKNISNLYYTNIPLKVITYDNSKFENKDNVEFTQFIPVVTSSIEEETVSLDEYNTLLDQNNELSNALTNLVSKYENNDSEQMILAMKEEIINLRIQLGQGSSETDFSEDFPYLPK